MMKATWWPCSDDDGDLVDVVFLVWGDRMGSEGKKKLNA